MSCVSESDALKTSIGVFVCLGLWVSYLPQIVMLKSSLGFSPYFLLLGAIGCISTLSNLILLQFPSLRCCIVQWDLVTCLGNILGVLQIAIQFACFGTLLALYYGYFPKSKKSLTFNSPDQPTAPRTEEEDWIEEDLNRRSETSPLWKVSLQVLWTVIVYLALATLAIPTMLLQGNAEQVQILAGAFGIISALSGIIQFVPQIVHTAIEKEVGSLSIPMMLMQCPVFHFQKGPLTDHPQEREPLLGDNIVDFDTDAPCVRNPSQETTVGEELFHSALSEPIGPSPRIDEPSDQK